MEIDITNFLTSASQIKKSNTRIFEAVNRFSRAGCQMKQTFVVGSLSILMPIMLAACATPGPEIDPFAQSVTLEQNIKGAIAPFMEAGGSGGVVLVADNSSGVVEHTFGNARLSPDSPITATTPFYLASVSKQFTSTAVMLLVERGALSVDDPISDFFPEAPEDWKAITIHHLLTHTSGLETYYRSELDKKRAPITNQRVVSWALSNVRLAAEPGERFSYSNTGYVLLAEIIARISGVSVEQFMFSEIFQPANMNNTIAVAQFDDFPKDRAIGYRGGKLDDRDILTIGDGGIFSTASDLLKWSAEIDNNLLVTKDTFQTVMKSHVTVQSQRYDYGYGWYIEKYHGTPVFSHSGRYGGYSTIFTKVPNHDATIVILTNSSASWVLPLQDRIIEYLIARSE